MPKITVHGGATNGPQVVGGAWGDSDDAPAGEVVTVGEQGAEAAHLPPGAVVSGGEEDETLDGPSEPLPEATEGDTTEHVSESDYEAWTVPQLREVLAEQELPTSGLKPELIARLRKHDETGD
jgi:hypothetical protein